MDDLIAALLSGLLELLAEFIFQFVMELFFSSVARLFPITAYKPHKKSPWLVALILLSLGAITGTLSATFFPHPLVPHSRFHGISLLLAPLLTGGAMAVFGAILRSKNRQPLTFENFCYGFTLALGMAAARFLMLK